MKEKYPNGKIIEVGEELNNIFKILETIKNGDKEVANDVQELLSEGSCEQILKAFSKLETFDEMREAASLIYDKFERKAGIEGLDGQEKGEKKYGGSFKIK